MSVPAQVLQPTFVHSPHPLLAAAGRRVASVAFEPGESIAAFLERQHVRARGPHVLTLNGRRVPRRMWAHVRPKPGALITLRATVEGGGGGDGGGKSPISAVLQIALMVAAPGIGNAIAGALGVSGTAFSIFGTAISWGQVFGGIVSVAGGFLINNLLAPPPARQQLSQAAGRYDNPSPTYSLTGGSNRARPFETMPLAIGRHRMYADAGAKTYSEFEGDDQYLYQVFNFGLSDVVLSDFRIGATPISAFAGVTLEESGPSGALTLFPGNVDTFAGGSLTAAAGWIQRTSSPETTALAIDLAGSLYRAGQAGIETLSATFELEYRAVGSGSWLPFWGGASAVTLSSASRKPIRNTYRISVAAGQYEVRVRRTSADDTDAANVSSIDWTQLRSYQPDDADYMGQKRVALKIKASGQINGTVEQLSAIASARCEAWNGSAWVTAETSNPAWWVRWFAKGKSIGGRRAFGAQLADARIDEANLKAFGAWCASKSLEVNAVLDRPMSCAEVLDTIARLGRGQCTWSTGKLGVVWDAPNQPVVAVFGMASMRAGSFGVEYVSEKLADEVGVTFVNPDRDWQQDTVYATAPGVANPVTRATVELFGCTSADQAGREANLIAANQTYRRRRVRWETDMEGLVPVRGDVVVVSHDLTQWGASGRLVEGSTASVLKLDRKVSYSSGAPYVAVRLPNGTIETVAVAAFSGESDSLTLSAALSQNPGADPDGHVVYDYTYLFDPRATPGKQLKVVDVEPLSEHYVRLTAFDEEESYYLAETNAYTAPADPAETPLPTISGLTITEELVPAGAGYAVRLVLTWDVSGPYGYATVRSSVGGENLVERGATLSRRFELLVPDTGTATVEVTARDAGGRWQAGGRVTREHAIAGKSAPPPDVPWATIDGQTISFGTVIAEDLAGYEIRYRPGQHGRAAFSDAPKLVSGLVTASPYALPSRPVGLTTIYVASVDTSGNYCASPAIIVVDLGDPIVANIVETIDLRALGFPGTITNGTVSGGDLEADDTGGLFWPADDAAPFWGADSTTYWPTVNYEALTYEAQVAPTLAGAGSTLTLDYAIAGSPVVIEYRKNGPGPFWDPIAGETFWGADDDQFWADPPDYSAWPGQITIGNEPVDIRIRTGFGTTRGEITHLQAIVDMPDIVEDLNDVTIAATTGTRLPITKTYRAIVNVKLTAQAGGGGAISARTEDKDASLGPLVTARDAAGAAVAGLVDATVQGY